MYFLYYRKFCLQATKSFASKTDGYSNRDTVRITEFVITNLICDWNEQSNITYFIFTTFIIYQFIINIVKYVFLSFKKLRPIVSV